MQAESPQLPDISQQSSRLEVGLRNCLQIEIMRRWEFSSQEEELWWVDRYGRRISDIIDGPDDRGKTIRDLCRQGKIAEAAKIVIATLNAQNN